MGTRNLTCVVLNGEYVIAQYGQWDGYPDGQGKTILEFLRNEMDRPVFVKALRNLSWITPEEYKATWIAVGEDPDNDSGFVSMDISLKHAKLYPHLHKDTGGAILSVVQKNALTTPIPTMKLENSIGFAGESLSCEWAYVVDMDRNTFEVYKGFNEAPVGKAERFYGLPTDDFVRFNGAKYYEVKFVVSFGLDNLPELDEFIMLAEGKAVRCPKCSGKKYECDCPDCDGTGVFCHNDNCNCGHINCPECVGLGYIDLTCPRCKGEGEHDCPVCVEEKNPTECQDKAAGNCENGKVGCEVCEGLGIKKLP